MDTPDGAYCLRIHRPAEGFEAGFLLDGHSPAEWFLGETALLRHMRSQGFGNILSTEDGLVPIDFSRSGTAAMPRKSACCCPADDDAALFLSLSVLLFIGSQHGRFHAEEWFHERMAYWCRTPFVHGLVS